MFAGYRLLATAGVLLDNMAVSAPPEGMVAGYEPDEQGSWQARVADYRAGGVEAEAEPAMMTEETGTEETGTEAMEPAVVVDEGALDEMTEEGTEAAAEEPAEDTIVWEEAPGETAGEAGPAAEDTIVWEEAPGETASEAEPTLEETVAPAAGGTPGEADTAAAEAPSEGFEDTEGEVSDDELLSLSFNPVWTLE